jgi:hypothetical protein
MVTYEAAVRAHDYHMAQLYDNHPEIVSISPTVKLNDAGKATDEAVIIIGIRKLDASEVSPHRLSSPLPDRLVIPDEFGKLTLDSVDVVYEEEGQPRAQAHLTKERPCPGGFSIMVEGGQLGTLGGLARRPDSEEWCFILSNNHIIARKNEGRLQEPVAQPGFFGQFGVNEKIAEVEHWIDIDFDGGFNEVDCAIAKVLSPASDYVQRAVVGIGKPEALGTLRHWMDIRVSGCASELPIGRLVTGTGSVRLDMGGGQFARFRNQLKYSITTTGGDSGALVWDADAPAVLGLHIGGSVIDGITYGYANRIEKVQDALNIRLV